MPANRPATVDPLVEASTSTCFPPHLQRLAAGHLADGARSVEVATVLEAVPGHVNSQSVKLVKAFLTDRLS